MYKKILPLILFCSATYAQVSKDTIYLNASKEITDKVNATQYAIQNDHGTTPSYYSIYDLSSQQMILQGKAMIEDNQTFVWVGEVNSFYNGNLLTNVFFFDQDGQYDKVDSYHPITKEKFTVAFENGYMTDGKISTVEQGLIIYIEIDKGEYKLIQYSDLENPLNRQEFQYENSLQTQNNYFNKKGDLLYSCTYQDGTPYSGTVAQTFNQSLDIDFVTTYEKAQQVNIEGFYSNGAKKYTTTTSPEYTKSIYFDKNGDIMGEYFINNNSYYKDGKDYSFDYQNGTQDRIASTMEYKDDQLYSVSYYDTTSEFNPILETSFYDANSQLDSIQYFDANQKLRSTLTYKDYSPLNGTKYDTDQITTYKDARIVEQTTYYPNTKVLFEYYQDHKSTYYDFQQNSIGTLEYNPQNISYLEPYNGQYFSLETTGITQQDTYKNGHITQVITFYPNQDFTQKLRPASKVISALGQSTKTYFYPNGVIRELSNYTNFNYQDSLANAKYYHPNNTLMGQFEGEKGQGTIIEFSKENIPISFSEYENGQLTHQKSYALKENNYWSEDIEKTPDSYFLQKEIDFNKKGVFYDYHNQSSSVVEYKNRLPYNGEVWLMDSYNFTKIPYQKGLVHGKKQQLSVSDFISILSQEYYQDGELIKEEVFFEGELQEQIHYKNGLKDGLYTSYNVLFEPTLISEIEYKQGEPYDGFLQESLYYYTVTTNYKNGRITTKSYLFDSYSDPQISAQDVFQSENHFTRTWYKEQDKLLSYQVQDDLLQGDVVFFEDGKPKKTVTFNKGSLVQGEIKLLSKKVEDIYDFDSFSQEQEPKYYLWNKNKNKVDLRIFTQSDNSLLYHLEAKIRREDPKSNVLGINQITPCQLFVDFEQHQALCEQESYY
ncbi:hypothetical protein ACYSNM_04925 [Myroides sp. LJL116]